MCAPEYIVKIRTIRGMRNLFGLEILGLASGTLVQTSVHLLRPSVIEKVIISTTLQTDIGILVGKTFAIQPS